MKLIKLGSLMFIVFLTACWNAHEVDKYYYAYSLGVDYTDGIYDVYIQYFSFNGGQAESESSGGGDESGISGHGRGKTIDTAIHNIYKTNPLNAYWGHLSVIVFSERLLETSSLNIIDFQTRFRDMRFTPWVFTTTEPLEKLLTTQPFFNVSLAYSLYSDPMKDYEQSSLVIPIRLHTYVANVFEPGRTNIIPQLTINNVIWSSEKGKTPVLQVSGGTLQKGAVYKGSLKNDVLNGLNWMQNKMERAPLIIKDDNGNESGVVIINDLNTTVTPIINGDDITFELDVIGSGVIVEMLEELPVSEFIKAGEKQMKEEIMATYEHALKINADIYQLGESLHRKHPKIFRRLIEKNHELPLAKDSIAKINTKLKVKHTGRLKYHPIDKKMNLK